MSERAPTFEQTTPAPHMEVDSSITESDDGQVLDLAGTQVRVSYQNGVKEFVPLSTGERAPTLTIAPQYERGRAPVAESMPAVPLAPAEQSASPEQIKPLTAADLHAKLTEFSNVLAAEDETFDAATWLDNPETGSDEEVFKRILDRLSDGDEQLGPIENAVFSYVDQELALRRAEDALEEKQWDIFEGDKLNHALVSQANQLEAKGGNTQAVEALRRAKVVLDRETSDDEATPLNEFYMTAEKQREGGVVTNEEKGKVTAKMVNALAERTRMTAAYTYLAENMTETELTAITERQTDMSDLRAQQQEATEKLAELTAKRQKRVLGLDFSGRGAGLNGTKHEQLSAERAKLNQKLIAEEIRDKTFASEQEIDLFIATRTVELCHEYDEAIRQNYMKNDGPVGKAINFLTGRNPDGTPDKSKKKMALRIGLQVGLAAGIGAATITFGGAMAVAAGAATGLRVYAQGQKIVRDRRVKRTGGLLTAEEVQARITAVDKDQETYNKESDEFVSGAESYRTKQLEVASQFETKKIEKDTLKWKLGNLGTVAAGVIAGAAVGTIASGVMSGGEHAAAADPSGAGTEGAAQVQPPAVDTLPSTETFIGPSNVYVSPGDGFYSVFENMHIPESQWSSILHQIGPDLVQSGDAYWMPDGTPGLSSPGMLSQHAFEAIMRAKGL